MSEKREDHILVVDDDQYLLAAIGQTLTLSGYSPELEANPVAAIERVESGAGGPYLVVIADIRMPHLDGIQLLGRVRSFDPDLPVIMITGHGDIALAVQAIREGAYDFLEKPVDDEVLLASLQRAIEKRRLILENRRLQEDLARRGHQSFFQGMVGAHPLMQTLYQLIETVAPESDPVLVAGETGTGKELVAQAIHQLSRAREKFVGVNMAALPAETMEAELFGYEKGAFTGATTSRMGTFEFAGEGTIFLDEICSLDLVLQAKLLRVLEEKQFRRLGSNSSRPLLARIISATNRNLEAEIEAGRFRKDLYYRLNVLNLTIPSLTMRMEDIPLLVEFFRQEYCRERDQQIPPFDQAVIAKIAAREWPGNVRELRSHVRRLCIFGCVGTSLQQDDCEGQSWRAEKERATLREFMELREKEYIEVVLRECGGKVGVAHQILGLSRKGLYDKINRYEIELASYREQEG